MTLGGLALAVGILVDDATVTIENINYHLEQGKDVEHGDSRRRASNRAPGTGVDAVDLHRVRADVPARRHRQVSCSFRWPRRWCSRCSPPICCRARSFRRSPSIWLQTQETRTHDRGAAGALGALPGRLRAAASSACATGYRELLERAPSTAARASPRCSCSPWRRPRILAFPIGPLSRARPGLLPDRRCRPAQAAPAGAAPERASRRPPRCAIGWRATIREHHPARARSPPSSTTSACPTAASISPTAPRRRSDPAMPTSSSTLAETHHSTDEYSARAARAAGGRFTPRRSSRSCRPTSSARS